MRIKQNYLKAVLLAAPKNDTRYYLNGVYIEHNGIETRLVAADGHRQHVVRIIHYGVDAVRVPTQSFIIPYDTVKKICATKSRYWGSEIDLTYEAPCGNNSDGYIVANLLDGTRITTRGVDGSYPKYRRIIPRAVSDEPVPLDPRYLLDAKKAIALFKDKKEDMGLLVPRYDTIKAFLQYGHPDGDMIAIVIAGLEKTAPVSETPSVIWQAEL